MADFHFLKAPLSRGHGGNQLAVRRSLHRMRRLGASFCLGLAVFLILQTLAAMAGHRQILVASTDIARGDAITASMVSIRTMTGSPDLQGAFTTPDQVLGRVTRVSVTRDRPLLDVMVTSRPREPPGTTSVGLHLASSVDSLSPGDQVRLLAPHGCRTPEPVPSSLVRYPLPGSRLHDHDFGRLDTFPADEAGTAGACLLAGKALVLDLPRKPQSTTATGPGIRPPDQEGPLVTMALDPDDAVRVLSMDPSVPLIAVHLKDGAQGRPGGQPTPSRWISTASRQMSPIMGLGIQTCALCPALDTEGEVMDSVNHFAVKETSQAARKISEVSNKGVVGEFKQFISRGSMIDMAVGVVMGSAVTAIVNSIVNNLISPLIAMIFGKPDLSGLLNITYRNATISFGAVLTALLNFFLIALAVYFCIIMPINKLRQISRAASGVKEEPGAPSTEDQTLQLLQQIAADIHSTRTDESQGEHVADHPDQNQ